MNNFVGVACGRHHTITFTKSGQVYAWGDNSKSQIGSSSASSPMLITGKSIDNKTVVGVAAGQRHSIVLYVTVLILTI